MAYLAGERVKIGLPMRLPGLLQDIADAKLSERLQVNNIREGRSQDFYTAPRHRGILGRENVIITWSQEEFLDLVRLSQPELVESLYDEIAEASAEAEPHEGRRL